MTLYKAKFWMLPEKLTYIFVKREDMGLVWLFKAHYSMEHQASHSTRKLLRSQSASFCFFPVLGHSQVPTLALGEKPLFSGKGSGQSLGLTQHQLNTHIPCTQLTIFLPQLPLWHWAISPSHSFSCREHHRCKPRASTRALLIPPAPPIPSWSEALAWCTSMTQTHTPLH